MFLENKVFIVFFGLVLLKTACCQPERVPISKLATCKEFVTNRTCLRPWPIDHLKNLRDNQHRFYIKLYVQSYYDANIGFSTYGGNVEARITLGQPPGYSSLSFRDQIIDYNYTSNVLSPLWATPVYIYLEHNYDMRVAIPGLSETFLKGNVDLYIKYICLEGNGEQNRWFYNCEEPEELCTPHSEPSLLSNNSLSMVVP